MKDKYEREREHDHEHEHSRHDGSRPTSALSHMFSRSSEYRAAALRMPSTRRCVVVAIAGRLGSGKSTLSDCLACVLGMCGYVVAQRSYATPLKRMSLPLAQALEAQRPQTGPDREPLALSSVQHLEALKRDRQVRLGGVLTVRQIYQVTGDMVRSVCPDFFVWAMAQETESFMAQAPPDARTVLLIDDVRCPLELDPCPGVSAVRTLRIKVTRPGAGSQESASSAEHSHTTEQDLPDSLFTRVLRNDGDLVALITQAKALVPVVESLFFEP